MEKIKVVCSHCHEVNTLPKKDSYKKALCGHCKTSLLSAKVIELTQTSFDHVIVNTSLPVIVDFWASWCGPCKMFAPTFTKASQNYTLKAIFAKVNTEQEQQLSALYNIRSIPTLIIFKEGKEVHRVSGAIDESNLNYLVNSFI